MTLNKTTLVYFASIFSIMIVTTLIFNSNFYNIIINTAANIGKDNHHPNSVSTISPFPIGFAWAVSLDKTMESASTSSPTRDNITIDIISQPSIHELAGQSIKIKGIITNSNPNDTTKSGIAYISIVDIKDKIPIDLEDWSAEKGLYVPAIKGGQSLPLEWNVRLVKAGTYTIDILFSTDNSNTPVVASPRIPMEVLPKINLNPSNVLPIAFGVPAVVIAILFGLNYHRGKKTGIYK